MLRKTHFHFPEVIFGALFAVAVFATGMVFESSYRPEHYKQHDQTENSTTQISAKSSTDERIADYTEALAWYTAVLAVSTVGLLIATWFGVRSQNKDTRILQRAYLAVEGGGASPFSGFGESIAEIRIRNVGNLPARNVRWFIDVDVSEAGDRSDFSISEQKFFGSGNVVPPGTEMRRSQRCIFTKDELYVPRGKSLYVWGEVRYSDGFNEERFTRFCHRYPMNQLETNGLSTQMPTQAMRYHRFGNDAD